MSDAAHRSPAASAVGDKEPRRTCLGCGKKQSKWLLHRLVLTVKHQVVVDTPQTAPGRGAYLCGAGCLKAALKRKAFQRALRATCELDLTILEEALREPVRLK